jgi:ketosteroid isomerase-like protein
MSEIELRAVVEACYGHWNTAFNRGDAAGIAALYAPHAHFLPATHEVCVGPAEIQRFFAGVLASGLTGHANEILAVGGDGRLIHAATRWTARGKGGDGAETQHTGLALHVLERLDDGSLRIVAHSFN